jgi:glycosyltransferase involved in cell wall biosynthesis
MRPIRESTFLVVANGTADQPPASGVHEFLRARRARRVTTVFHPLGVEDPGIHEVVVYERDREPRRRTVRLPSHPPYTFPLDLLVPLWPPAVDCWLAFNNMHCARGLLARRAGWATRVVYWAVDFVPERFGPGPLTKAYDAVDAYCCRQADLRIELSEPALEGRNGRHRVHAAARAPTRVVPVGAWLDRLPVVPEDALAKRRVVFIGHLVPRQGVGISLDAMRILRDRGVQAELEIAGTGPLFEQLRATASEMGIERQVSFRGFLDDHRDVEAFLASGSIAVAPYDPTGQTFTRYADPSKLKAYLAAGLPILTTDVPPNAHELAERGGAQIVGFDATAYARAIEQLLGAPEEWARRRAAALDYVRDYDWNRLLEPAFADIGFR